MGALCFNRGARSSNRRRRGNNCDCRAPEEEAAGDAPNGQPEAAWGGETAATLPLPAEDDDAAAAAAAAAGRAGRPMT